MTREEAIQILTRERDEDIFGGWTPYRKRIHEAFTLAIEALKHERTDEWCTDCKEYDTEKKCCPRFNRVIKGAVADALDAMPSADRSRGEWIPCSERLPSEDGKYLVFYAGTIIGSNIEVMRYGEPLMPNVDVSGKHFYRSDAEWGDIIYDEIIAWMPLPESYKGDADMRGDQNETSESD